MSIPPPPDAIEPQIVSLPAGTLVHRIHQARFGPVEFNPGLGVSRFAPTLTTAGAPIPTVYAATSFDCAASETIFHDIDPSAAFKSVPMRTIETLHHSTLRPTRDLLCAGLFEPDLNRLGCTRADLIDTPRSAWPETRAWSAAFHRLCPGIDGLVWTSRRHDQYQAMILFGDRVRPADLLLERTEHIATSAIALGALQRLAYRAGIVLTY